MKSPGRAAVSGLWGLPLDEVSVILPPSQLLKKQQRSQTEFGGLQEIPGRRARAHGQGHSLLVFTVNADQAPLSSQS